MGIHGEGTLQVRRITTSVRALCIVLLLVLVGVAACKTHTDVPARSSVDEKIREAALGDQLRIGVYDNQPLMGYVANGVNKGFDVDIARYIAKSLGYDGDRKIQWVIVPTVDDRMTYLAQGKVDLIVASLSITEARKQSILFAGPYLVTEQSVLISASLHGKISTIQDLKNPAYKVCTSTGSTSEDLLKDRAIPYESLDSDTLCYEGILAGKYQAMSTDRTVLLGFQSEHPDALELLDVKLATATNAGVERLGVGIPKTKPALRELVDYFLNKSYTAQQKGASSPWQVAYDAYFAGRAGPAAQPPPDDVPDLVDYDAKDPTS